MLRRTPRNRPLRAGVIGVGGIGSVHCECLQRLSIPISGVAASSADSARRHAARLGGEVVAFADAQELIASPEVDVVHVCTTNDTHPRLAELALRAGKHVLCEKPLALAAARARELARLARASPGVGAVAYNYRFYPMLAALRRLATQGELGQIHLVRGAFLLEEALTLRPPHWLLDDARRGTSFSLADVGVHWWDLLEYTTDRCIAEVICAEQIIRSDADRGEDASALLLRAPGLIASATLAQAAAGHGTTFEIELIGDRGSASWTLAEPDRLTVRPLSEARRIIERGQPGFRIGDLDWGYTEGHTDAFMHLIAAVYDAAGGGDVDYPTMAEAAHGAAILEAALESSASGRWTPVAA